MLSKEGLLEPGPKRGYKIRSFTIEEIVDAYEMRATLEGTACRLLAERGLSEEMVGRSRELLDFGDLMLERGNFTSVELQPWSEMNHEFHAMLIDAAANSMLKNFVEQTHQVPLSGPRHVHWYRFDSENFELARHAHRDHHEVFNAIVRRQGSRAEARMREHIYFSLDLVRQHFRNQTVGFDTVVQLRPGTDGRTR
jgi:GntR family transcriptional regulator of vanillate catabolism